LTAVDVYYKERPENGENKTRQQIKEKEVLLRRAPGIALSGPGRRLPRGTDRSGGEVVQEAEYALGLSGKDQFGGYFGQGSQNKRSLPRPGVREGQMGRGSGLFAEADQIQVERAWFVEHLFGAASELTFPLLKGGQQGLRRLAGTWREADYRIEEMGGAGGTIHRGGLPEGGLQQRRVGKGLETIDGLAEYRRRITQVRSEGDEDQ